MKIFEMPNFRITFVTGADLSDYQYRGVKLNSSGLLTLAGVDENVIGVLQTPEESGKPASVMLQGVTFMTLGATVATGANVTCDALGRAITASGDAPVLGVCLVGGAVGTTSCVLLVNKASSGTNTKSIVSIPIKLANLADGDIATAFIPGFAGTILSAQFMVTDPATTASKLSTLNLEIGDTNVTGGVIALTSAKCTPLGKVTAGTAITAENVFTATDTISVEASSTTAFVEGEGVLMITLG